MLRNGDHSPNPQVIQGRTCCTTLMQPGVWMPDARLLTTRTGRLASADYRTTRSGQTNHCKLGLHLNTGIALASDVHHLPSPGSPLAHTTPTHDVGQSRPVAVLVNFQVSEQSSRERSRPAENSSLVASRTALNSNSDISESQTLHLDV